MFWLKLFLLVCFEFWTSWVTVMVTIKTTCHCQSLTNFEKRFHLLCCKILWLLQALLGYFHFMGKDSFCNIWVWFVKEWIGIDNYWTHYFFLVKLLLKCYVFFFKSFQQNSGIRELLMFSLFGCECSNIDFLKMLEPQKVFRHF